MTKKLIISLIIGIVIIWLLLSSINPGDIPKTIAGIPPKYLIFAFVLYTISVFLKSLRFKIILSTGIKIRNIFPIVSLYMFFANILPMRAGELSYMYLLKKEDKTPGAKSFASLVIGAVADIVIIAIAMLIIGWHLRTELVNNFSSLNFSTDRFTFRFFILIATILIMLAAAGIAVGKLSYMSVIRQKLKEIIDELKKVNFDLSLIKIILISALIIFFRFLTQWYLVRSMEVSIGVWEFSFALIFGVFFSLIPIHGPAGFGTVEAPWVLALMYLNVSKDDAIISGFALHILIMLFCIILGIYGAVSIKLLK